MTDLSDRLLAVREPEGAKRLVAEAEAWLREHPRDYAVLTAMEQAQRMAGQIRPNPKEDKPQ